MGSMVASSRVICTAEAIRSIPRMHGSLPLAKKDVASLLDTTSESPSRALRSLAGQV
jgi:hypothetical protein